MPLFVNPKPSVSSQEGASERAWFCAVNLSVELWKEEDNFAFPTLTLLIKWRTVSVTSFTKRRRRMVCFSLSTAVFIHSFARFWRWGFGNFHWLVSRYCSYLLPKQDLTTLNKQRQQNMWMKTAVCHSLTRTLSDVITTVKHCKVKQSLGNPRGVLGCISERGGEEPTAIELHAWIQSIFSHSLNQVEQKISRSVCLHRSYICN